MTPVKATPRRLWGGLIGASVAALGLVYMTKPEPQAALREELLTRVEVRPALRAAVSPAERAVGRLMPSRRATLSFEVPGRVVRRVVEPGTEVHKGQALLQLDDGDARNQLEEADAQLKLEQEAVQRDRELLSLAERNAVLQRSEVRRFETLKTKSLTSGSQLDTARQTQIQLEAEVARLQHAVQTAPARLALKRTLRDQAARQLERTVLRAPFDGTVNRVEIDIGDYVAVQTPAVELVDLTSLDLYVEVRGEVLDNLELGQSLAVTAGGRTFAGRLHALQYDPDPTTHTHALLVRLPAGQARPGAIAEVELPRKPLASALVVPVSAITAVGTETSVFRYVAGELQRKPVALGPRVGDLQVISSGLDDGDLVVPKDVAGLSDGQAVAIVTESS